MLRSILFALMMALVSADFSGEWKMTVATTPLRAVELPGEDTNGVTMVLKKHDANTYKVGFHAGNRLMGGLTIVEELSDTSAKVVFSSLSSTRMMPPPGYEQVEAFIQHSIPQIATMQIDSDGAMILEGNNANLSAKLESVTE